MKSKRPRVWTAPQLTHRAREPLPVVLEALRQLARLKLAKMTGAKWKAVPNGSTRKVTLSPAMRAVLEALRSPAPITPPFHRQGQRPGDNPGFFARKPRPGIFKESIRPRG